MPPGLETHLMEEKTDVTGLCELGGAGWILAEDLFMERLRAIIRERMRDLGSLTAVAREVGVSVWTLRSFITGSMAHEEHLRLIQTWAEAHPVPWVSAEVVAVAVLSNWGRSAPKRAVLRRNLAAAVLRAYEEAGGLFPLVKEALREMAEGNG
jgi:hypothetical protein